MYNFMQCSSLMFGARVKYGIAFKSSEKDYKVFTRKSYHNFKVCIDDKSYEGAVGLELNSIKSFALADGLNLGIYDQENFGNIKKWEVDVTHKEEGTQILFL